MGSPPPPPSHSSPPPCFSPDRHQVGDGVAADAGVVQLEELRWLMASTTLELKQAIELSAAAATTKLQLVLGMEHDEALDSINDARGACEASITEMQGILMSEHTAYTKIVSYMLRVPRTCNV